MRTYYAHMPGARRRPKPHPTKPPPTRARKTPANLSSLSLRVDLVQRAKALDLNLSEIVERALEKAIGEAEQARWLAENEAAIEHYNSVIEKYGLYGDELRQF
jgi:antitoxin CcdA